MGAEFGGITNPWSVRAKAPLAVALEHVLAGDCADCESPCDGAAFHDHLLCVRRPALFREEIILTAIPLRRCRRQQTPKSGHGSCIFFDAPVVELRYLGRLREEEIVAALKIPPRQI